MKSHARELRHKTGKEFMIHEDYYSAMNVFLDALEKHGPHVGLLADLTASLYMLGRIEDCMASARKLEEELNKALPLIKKENAARTWLFLGKIYEEEANVAKALSFYKNAVNVCDVTSVEVRVQAQAQLLRLQSFLGIKTDLQELYHVCLKLKMDSLYYKTELEHGLILAEVVLFGIKTATARAVSFLKDQEVLPFDVRLILIDLLEEGIRQRLNLSELSQHLKEKSLTNLDKFEEEILAFYKDSDRSLSVDDINYLSRELPTMGLLRIMVINLKNTKDKETNLELQRKLYFIMDGLDTESRALLMKKCELESHQQSKKIIFNSREGSISVQGKKLVLKKGSFAVACFAAFSEHRSLTIDEINEKLFGFSSDSDLYDRIRVAFWRLNKELGMITGLDKTFVFSKHGASLNTLFTLVKE